VFISQGRTMVWFYDLHYREKKFTIMCCSIRRNELYTGISNSGCLLSGTCCQKLSVEWHWLKFFEPDFLAFWSVLFLQQTSLQQTVSKANWTAITDTLTLNPFTRNTKHGFSSWKWSNLAWDSSSSLTIYFSIFLFLFILFLFSITCIPVTAGGIMG